MLETRCLTRSRSLNPSRKQFMLLNYTVHLGRNEVFEPYVELKGNLSMENCVFSKYINFTA